MNVGRAVVACPINDKSRCIIPCSPVENDPDDGFRSGFLSRRSMGEEFQEVPVVQFLENTIRAKKESVPWRTVD